MRGEKGRRVCLLDALRASKSLATEGTELQDDRDKINSHEYEDHELEYAEKNGTLRFHVS